MATKTPITVAYGDGIGPEIMAACLEIIEAAGAALEIEQIEVGEKVYLRGNTSGIEPSSWESLLRTKVFYKAPITTPQGGGYKSLNVTTRKMLGLYANIRPCVSYHPFVRTKHPVMDVVIVRENEEDLYAGIEYRTTPEEMQALKVITRPGSVFDPREPAAIGFYFEVEVRVFDLMLRCLAPHMPNLLPAGGFASICGTVIGGPHPDTGRHYTIVEPQLGGWGAMRGRDGNSAIFSGFHGETFNCPA